MSQPISSSPPELTMTETIVLTDNTTGPRAQVTPGAASSIRFTPRAAARIPPESMEAWTAASFERRSNNDSDDADSSQYAATSNNNSTISSSYTYGPASASSNGSNLTSSSFRAILDSRRNGGSAATTRRPRTTNNAGSNTDEVIGDSSLWASRFSRPSSAVPTSYTWTSSGLEANNSNTSLGTRLSLIRNSVNTGGGTTTVILPNSNTSSTTTSFDTSGSIFDRGYPATTIHQNRPHSVPSSARPQFRSKAVCQLSCKYCSNGVCRRGMKAILLADMAVELFSTDMPPSGVALVNDDYQTRKCQCRIRDVACLGCGNVIGYHVTQPCQSCMESCNNGHFWMFHVDHVNSIERMNATGTKTLLWANLSKAESDLDQRDPYDSLCR